MTYCEQCGSTSFDELGFCRGCGARLSGYASAQSQTTPTSHSGKAAGIVLPAEPQQQTIRLWGLGGFVQPEVKNVWVAVLLALFLGPYGLTYCTYLGAFVMLLVSVVAMFYCGLIVNLLILPICAMWAWFAARSANSIY